MRQKRQSLLDLASSAPQHGGARSVRNVVPSNGKIRSKVRSNNTARRQPDIVEDPAISQEESKTSKRFGFLNRKSDEKSSVNASRSTKVETAPIEPTPEYSNSYEIDPDKPLLDLFIIMRHIWRKKWLIIAFGIIGGLVGVLVALSTPHKYYTDSRLILDPRDVQVTDTVNSNNQASSQVLLAVVDSQMQVARSTSVLQRVVERLRLDQDPEFNGEDSNGLLAKIKSVVSPSSLSNDPFENAVNYLRKNMGLARDPETFLVYIGATTNNAEKSALVANTIVEEYLVEYKNQQSGIFAKTSNSIEARLEELRVKLDEAEKAIVDYRAENDIIDVGGGVINEKEMLALSNELAKVRADQVAKTVLANELRNIDVDGVISGSFPQAALSTTLAELRKQYTEAKSKSDSLAVGLGPRHPQYIAAKASADAVAVEIKNELTRIVSSTQNDVSRARDSENQLAEKLAVLKTRASSQSTENVGLRELERKAEAIRQIYESLLRRARETTERGNLETSVIQVIAKADPPQQPSTTSRKTTVILFGIMGGMLGLAIAFILGAIESLKQHSKGSNSRARQSHIPQSRAPQNTNYNAHDFEDEFEDQAPVRAAHEPQTRSAPAERAQNHQHETAHPAPHYQSANAPQMPPQHPVYPPQFNPVMMAQNYAAPQQPMPASYPIPQTQMPNPHMPSLPYGYPAQLHVPSAAQPQQMPQHMAPAAPVSSEVPQATQTPQTVQPSIAVNDVHDNSQSNDDREKVMRLKSDVQRLRAELENWAQSRNN